MQASGSRPGRIALVTGGGRGIGRAIALALAGDGAKVVVTGRTRAEIDAVAAETGGRAYALDLADREATDRVLAAVATEVGPVEILVNNAGLADSAPLAGTTDALWDRALEVNVTAPFRVARAVVPAMIRAGFGRVINVASNAGLTGYAYTSAYCASKHALVGLTRALAVEVAKSGVTVNAVCPGWVETAMADAAAARIAAKTGRSEEAARSALANMSPQGRLITPQEVAHLVLALCADEARGIHGQALVVDGGQVMA